MVQKNDGIVGYLFEGNKAFGRWALTGSSKVHAEDITRSIKK